MSLPPVRRRKDELKWLEYYLGRTPARIDLHGYRAAVQARTAGIVELTADWPEERFDETGFHWVFERCFRAAIDQAAAPQGGS
ncbi:MAG: hypothetical protein QF515_07920 [Pseudomonadales bacterium]|nr:hypothetical protein [Pseudomonadales bacterium]MDP6827025.1 hypothetical protein [Pseudomonadales bacterium]